MYLTLVKKRKEESPFLRDDHPIGCNAKEIEDVETCIGGRLPEAYREFLTWMGHSCGRFLQGSDCFYENLKDVQGYARDLLKEDHSVEVLPEDAFVFMHQGYYFLFFRLADGDDPPIYSYLENTAKPEESIITKEYLRLNDFLLAELETYIQGRKEIIEQNAEIEKTNPSLAKKLEDLDRSL
jgi:SMI1/KNR4 family protein SUKH-1